jgi:multiple sugar transport system permease protein
MSAKGGMSRLRQRNLRNGLLFIAPWLVGFFCFTLFPFVASLYFSFCDYDILSPPRFIGATNYVQLLTADPYFSKALYNTLFYTAFAVPLGVLAGVAIALLLNMKVLALPVYRTVYYLPSIVPVVAASVLWMWLLNPQYGLINAALGALHLPEPGWISDPNWSKPSLILMSTWGIGGSIVIYLAGLQDIPAELYEAAEIDGADPWQRIRFVTLPMLSPTIFFNLVMGLIGSLQYFTQAYVMTQGGPVDSTLFYSLYLFRRAFTYLDMGYASAMAWLLFLLIMALTAVTFRTSERWVHYAAEGR